MTVRVYTSGVADAPTETVKIEVASPSAGGVTCSGSKVAVTSEGTPETVRSTHSLKLFKEVMVMVDVSEPSSSIVRRSGEAVISKSGVGGGTFPLILSIMSCIRSLNSSSQGGTSHFSAFPIMSFISLLMAPWYAPDSILWITALILLPSAFCLPAIEPSF